MCMGRGSDTGRKTHSGSHWLEWGSWGRAVICKFSCKGPESKYLRLCGPSVLLKYSTLHESSHGPYVNEWEWLNSHKTWLMDTEIWISYNFHISLKYGSCLYFYFNYLKIKKKFKVTHHRKTGSGPTGHSLEISSRAMKTDEVADLFG